MEEGEDAPYAMSSIPPLGIEQAEQGRGMGYRIFCNAGGIAIGSWGNAVTKGLQSCEVLSWSMLNSGGQCASCHT